MSKPYLHKITCDQCGTLFKPDHCPDHIYNDDTNEIFCSAECVKEAQDMSHLGNPLQGADEQWPDGVVPCKETRGK